MTHKYGGWSGSALTQHSLQQSHGTLTLTYIFEVIQPRLCNKLLKYGTSCRVRSTSCTVLAGLSPYLALKITSIRGCVTQWRLTLTCIFKYLAVTLPISWIIFIYGTNTTHEGQCATYHHSVNRSNVKLTQAFNFCSAGGGILVDHWSSISNYNLRYAALVINHIRVCRKCGFFYNPLFSPMREAKMEWPPPWASELLYRFNNRS